MWRSTAAGPCRFIPVVMQLEAMTRQEYEERRRRLDEELRAGQELLEASHRAQVRALDLHWTAEDGSAVPVPGPPAEKRPRRPALELHEAILEQLDGLPEVFTKDDLCRALGETPDRRALYRVMQDLAREGWVRMEDRGMGRNPSSYRRLASPESE
jgi:hypothetical protein